MRCTPCPGAVEDAVRDEYSACFQTMLAPGGTYARVLLYCRAEVVSLVVSSRLPILDDAVGERVAGMHSATAMVCHCFLKHLHKTWFAVADAGPDAIERLARHLADHVHRLRAEGRPAPRADYAHASFLRTP